MAAGGGDLLIRVKFAGDDRLSKLLDNLSGASKRTARAIGDTTQALRQQTTELREVQRAMKAGGGNVTALVDKERALESSIARANRQLERQKKFAAIDARTGRAAHIGEAMVGRGESTLFSTALLAAPIFAIAKAGAEFTALQDRMRVLGLGRGAVDDLTSFAKAMNVAGSSVTDNLRYLLEAQGVFRETGETGPGQLAGAKLMAPLLARMHVAYAATGKELSEDQERYLLRFVEQSGGLTSPKRATALADGVFRALQSSGGNVQAQDYQGFKAHAGIGGFHLSDRAMFADFEPLIAELHEQAGVGLATAFKQATGIKVNKQAAAEYLKLGLWDASKVKLNNQGAVKSTNGNPLTAKAANLLSADPVEFYRQIMLPAYAKNGIKTDEQRSFENAKIFGGTGGNLYNLIDKQLPTLLKSRESYKKTQGLDTAYEQTNNSFFGEEGKLRAAAKDFMVAAGTKGGLLDGVVGLMTKATSALRAFTAFGEAHPTAFAWLGTIVTNLLALRALGAVGQIVFGGLLGPAARLWGVWSKYRAAGSLAEAFPLLAAAAPILGVVAAIAGLIAIFVALKNHFGTGVAIIGTLTVASGALAIAVLGVSWPLLAIIAGVGLLALAGYKLYQHWGGVVAFFKRAGPTMLLAIGPIGWAARMLIDHWAEVKTFFSSLWDGIADAFRRGAGWLRGMVPQFRSIGGMLLRGLIDGLDPVALAAHMLKLGPVAELALKGVLGIHSPSRVFAAIGGHMMDGLALGITRGATAPIARVRQAGIGVIAAGAVAITPAHARPARIAGAGGSTNHYSITINQRPGEDADALADRVMRRIEAKQARAGRSSYRDTD